MSMFRGAFFLSVLLFAGTAHAQSDTGAAFAPLAAVPVFGVLGGIFTTVVVAGDLSDGQKTHPAVRNIGLACGGINVAFGTAGLIATALVEENDFAAVTYTVSGTLVMLGLVGGTLSLVTDTYDPDAQYGVWVAPTPGGAVGALTLSF
jgi:hypothetical protein